MKRLILLFLLVASGVRYAPAQTTANTVPQEWQTHAERTAYRETSRYEETVAYARRLADAAPTIRYTTYGTSGAGRAMPLLIAARDADSLTPAKAHEQGRAVVFIQAGIHAGEIDGQDAGLALLRDIAITKSQQGLLDKVVILFTPVYNVDGLARFGPYQRSNQNGPAEMGWRGNASNMDLNRDAAKADAPETRAWLRLWNEWQPDLFIDCHVTDGADYRYDMTWQAEHYEQVAPTVREWQKLWAERVLPAFERDGHLASPYLEFRDNRDLTQGIDGFHATPRYHTGYAPLRNRPGLLLETHSLKDYRTRVRATYDILRETLAEINRDPTALLFAVARADAATISAGQTYDAKRQFPLAFTLTDQARPFLLKGVASRREISDVSGAVRVIWDESQPLDITVPFYDTPRTVASVAPPVAYIIPPNWTSVIEVLQAHGLETQTLKTEKTLEIESYRLTGAKWATGSTSGRVRVSYGVQPVTEKRTFPAGSIVVPMAQKLAHVAVHLLEPSAPDSLAAWGFFNLIWEQREYGESYILEDLARRMMRENPKLREEFEQRLLKDPQFAANARARLEFFWERSPYFDKQLGLYPVGRIVRNDE